MQFKKFYHRYELFEITENAFFCECYYAVRCHQNISVKMVPNLEVLLPLFPR